MNFAHTVCFKFRGIVFTEGPLPLVLILLFFVMPGFPGSGHNLSTLVSQSATTWIACHSDAPIASWRYILMTSLCLLRADLPCAIAFFGIILSCPYLASHFPVLASLVLSCLFLAIA